MTEIGIISRRLVRMGVDPDIIKMVRRNASRVVAPKMPAETRERLREVAQDNRRAVLVLSKSGHYSVFTPEGIKALSDSAIKNKPWSFREEKTLNSVPK